MLHVSETRASLVLVAALVVPACGESESPSAPARQYAQGTGSISGSSLAAHSTFCYDFDNAKAGPVSADVNPRSIHLVLAAGRCSAPGEILAEKAGEIANADAPEGRNHVTLFNRSDSPTAFTLRVTRWY